MAIAAISLFCVVALPDRGQARPVAERHRATSTVQSVTDGDTFRLASEERIRIANIDAPETRKGQARCQAERRLGETAKRRLAALIAGKTVRLARVGRSYDRTVAQVDFNGQDLATILVAQGDAAWWRRGTPKPRWCPAGR
jgi:micrococcal nuclease